MMKWTTKFSTVLGCALAAVFLFTSTMEVGAVPLTSSPSGTTTTTTTDTNAAEDGNADAAAEDNAAEDNAAGTAAAGTVTSATVTSSSVNIRSEASTSASVAGKAASGQELTVTGETQGSDGKTWYAVTFDNVSGYIRSDLVEAHVSEATAEPAVDETQETEEPEEEPIVDNSADYSVAFEDDGSGSSAWYLHDNTMGTRYQVSDLLNAEETNKNNQATIDQTAKSMRFVVILMAFVIVVLIIVVTILIIKVRSTYEDYDDYDDDEEDDEDDEDDDEDEEEEERKRKEEESKRKGKVALDEATEKRLKEMEEKIANYEAKESKEARAKEVVKAMEKHKIPAYLRDRLAKSISDDEDIEDAVSAYKQELITNGLDDEHSGGSKAASEKQIDEAADSLLESITVK